MSKANGLVSLKRTTERTVEGGWEKHSRPDRDSTRITIRSTNAVECAMIFFKKLYFSSTSVPATRRATLSNRLH